MTLHRRRLFAAAVFIAGCASQGWAAPEAGSVFHETPLPLNSGNPSTQPVQPAVPAAGYQPPVRLATRSVAVNPDRALHVGDQVSLEIVEDKTGPIPRLVTATGDIDVPPLGRVHVAGRNCSEVEAELKKKLEADYYYTATVHLAIDSVREEEQILGRVYVAGAVRVPGPVLLDPNTHETVSNIILKAGGFAQFADSKNVRVTRKKKGGDKETFSVNVLGVWKADRRSEDPDVYDGDYIYVAQKTINM